MGKDRSGGKTIYVRKGETKEDAAKRHEEKSKPKQISGDVSFAEIVNASPHSISFSKVVTILPDGYRPETGRKGDLGQLIDKYNINDVVIHMYRDRSGANDLKRMQDLGFTIQAQHKGTQQTGSSIPPRDYYFMKRTGKAVSTKSDNAKAKTAKTQKRQGTVTSQTTSLTDRETRRMARALKKQTRAQRKGRPKGSQ